MSSFSMDVDPPQSNLKRSSSAPMINIDINSNGDELIPPQLFGSQPRTRRFSASFSPGGCSSPQSPMPFRISQIKHEEGMDVVNREITHEREVRQSMQISQSYEDLTLETFPLGENKRNGTDLFASPISAGSSLSPTRGRKQCYSPTLQQPSPNRKYSTTRRCISPNPLLRPSVFSSTKRKCEMDEKTSESPNKKFHSLTPDRSLNVHPLTHSLSSNSLDDTASPEQTVPHSIIAGTPESVHSNDSMCSMYKSTDQDMLLSEPPTIDPINQNSNT